MGCQPDEDEVFSPPFPSMEALRPYIGKVVGLDEKGQIRVAGDTHREANDKARGAGLVDLASLWVPTGAVIGRGRGGQ
jgi:hypothetical protein